MTHPDSLTEAIARAILAERYQLENGRLNTNISWEIIDENTRVRYLDQARAALSAIEHAGYAVIPVEPTAEMLSRAAEAMPIEYEFRSMHTGGSVPGFPPAIRNVAVGFAKPKDRVDPRVIYAALLSSRPKVTE